MEIWLIDRGSGERVYRLTLREVAALRALKAYRADPTDKELYRKLFERAHDDRLRFQCCCRRVGSQYPDFHPRRHEKHEYLLVNRSGAAVTHAPDCVFRRGDAHALPPPRHPDLLGGFDAAGEELPAARSRRAALRVLGAAPAGGGRAGEDPVGHGVEADADGAPQPARAGRAAPAPRGVAREDRNGGRQALSAAAGCRHPGSCSPIPPPGARARWRPGSRRRRRAGPRADGPAPISAGRCTR